jgi:hypothetical protein
MLRILAPLSDEETKHPATSSPPPSDLDDATSEGLPVSMQPIVSVPDGDMPSPGHSPSKPPVVAASVEPAPDGALAPDAEVNGQVLKRLREHRGITLHELGELTKIRKQHLVAIEEQQLENLPARVYLRGYLTQIARVLKVDRDRLAEGYLSFVDRFQKK